MAVWEVGHRAVAVVRKIGQMTVMGETGHMVLWLVGHVAVVRKIGQMTVVGEIGHTVLWLVGRVAVQEIGYSCIHLQADWVLAGHLAAGLGSK